MLYTARKAEAQKARKVDDWGRVWLIGQACGSLFLRFMTGQVTPVPDLAAIPPLDHCPLPATHYPPQKVWLLSILVLDGLMRRL
jgi:hypothetical protein